MYNKMKFENSKKLSRYRKEIIKSLKIKNKNLKDVIKSLEFEIDCLRDDGVHR